MTEIFFLYFLNILFRESKFLISILWFLKFLFLFKRIDFTQEVEPFFPKNSFLKLLSIPIISKPLSWKKFTASEPTNPVEPVIIAKDILKLIF